LEDSAIKGKFSGRKRIVPCELRPSKAQKKSTRGRGRRRKNGGGGKKGGLIPVKARERKGVPTLNSEATLARNEEVSTKTKGGGGKPGRKLY